MAEDYATTYNVAYPGENPSPATKLQKKPHEYLFLRLFCFYINRHSIPQNLMLLSRP